MGVERCFVCPHCKKKFSRKSNLLRHNLNVHQNENTNKFICHNCADFFKYKSNLMRHLEKCGKNNTKTYEAEAKCPLCDYQNSRVKLLRHFGEKHNIELVTESEKFANYEDFTKWKETIEKSDTSKYVRYASKKYNRLSHQYYRCHCDGFFKSKGQNMRRMKSTGSNKINGFCPSKIDVSIDNASGEVSIKFIRTHVGHEMELRKIWLSKSEREKLAKKISQNISFDQIIEDVKTEGGKEVERIHLLTKKDLYNIKRMYNLKQTEENDVDEENYNNSSVELQEAVIEEQADDEDLEMYQERLLTVFQNIVNEATTVEKCKNIEEALLAVFMQVKENDDVTEYTENITIVSYDS